MARWTALLWLLALVLIRARPTLAAEAPVTQADRDWEAYQAASRQEPKKPWEELSPLEEGEFIEGIQLANRELGLAFLTNHPSDPRRWKIVAEFEPAHPRFVLDWRSVTNALVDTNAAAAWARRVAELKASMTKATDVPPEVREREAYAEAKKPFEAAEQAVEEGKPVDLARLKLALAEHTAKHPSSDFAFYLFVSYAMLLEECEFGKHIDEWKAFASSPNAKVAEFAKSRLGFYELTKNPLDISFTSVDGRPVDLQQLRGKVVLIDFWATWCAPCVAELPKVAKLYEENRAKGFEVVGISLEMADVASTDSPEQATAKRTKAKRRLTDFLAKWKIQWPQFFDGEGWEGSMAKKFALTGIPTLLLLDRDGRLVTYTSRADVIAKEVTRRLKP